ncbi:MAG: hypothetical protein HZC37_27035 [Burkholderiales bacterium]|nr:hypothetical protein [Burkholderiales bacterium]
MPAVAASLFGCAWDKLALAELQRMLAESGVVVWTTSSAPPSGAGWALRLGAGGMNWWRSSSACVERPLWLEPERDPSSRRFGPSMARFVAQPATAGIGSSSIAALRLQQPGLALPADHDA